MRKILVAGAVLLGLTASFPGESQAQFYSSYTYSNNAYLNYALASQRAKAAGQRARSSRRTHHKRVKRQHRRVRRQARR